MTEIRSVPGIYQANNVLLSAQNVQWDRLNAVSDVLANANTPGARGYHLKVVTVEQKTPGFHNQDVAYVAPGGIYRNFQEGPLKQTGNTLDVALQGKGFFSIRSTETQKDYYTRAGRFQINSEGQLVTNSGDLVLDASGSPIAFPKDTKQIQIKMDGTIYTDTGKLGQIGVVTFNNEQALVPSVRNGFTTNEPPQVSTNPVMIQGAYEESNVEPIKEVVRMIDILRIYESIQNFIEKSTSNQQKMISLQPQSMK